MSKVIGEDNILMVKFEDLPLNIKQLFLDYSDDYQQNLKMDKDGYMTIKYIIELYLSINRIYLKEPKLSYIIDIINNIELFERK